MAETNRSFRASQCCAEQVLVSDNCFDFFNCHEDWPRLWHRVQLKMRAHYLAVTKPKPAWTEGLALLQPSLNLARPYGATVVMHVRLGDASERRLPMGYYIRAILALRAELSKDGRGPPIFRLQTNGLPANLRPLLQHPAINGTDGLVVADHSKYSVCRSKKSFSGRS